MKEKKITNKKSKEASGGVKNKEEVENMSYTECSSFNFFQQMILLIQGAD